MPPLCPTCKCRPATDAVTTRLLLGLGLFSLRRRSRIVGCRPCLDKAFNKNLLQVFLFGWWSLHGWMTTPVFLLINVFTAYQPLNPPLRARPLRLT